MMTSVNAVPIIFKETMISLYDINVILEYKKGASIKRKMIIPVYVVYQIYDKH